MTLGRHRGNLHPPGSRQRHPDAEGRLHRGGAGAGHRRAWVVYRHAFSNALVPVVTVVGLSALLLLGARSSPRRRSTGRASATTLVHYLENRDYAAVQGIIVVFALVVVVVSLVIDFVNAFIDPRIRY